MVEPNRKYIRALAFYFVLAFGIAWASWFPSFLHPRNYRLLAFVGLFAPALSAGMVAFAFNRKQGVAELLGRYAILRFKAGWYLFSILLVPLLFMLSLSVESIFFHQHFEHLLLPGSPIFTLVSFVWLMVINSGEEIGWRGFALPRLQKLLHNPFYASIILGLLWSVWHLPIYLVPCQSSIPFAMFIFFTTGLSLIYTVVFNQTRGSLFSVVLLHASTDIAPRFLNITVFQPSTWLIFGIFTWLSGILLFLFFPASSTVQTGSRRRLQM